jgi:hypothetical protein
VYVAAWSCETGYAWGTDPNATDGHDDWQRGGEPSRGKKGRTRYGHQDIDLVVDQLLGQRIEALIMTVRSTLVDGDSPALDVAKIAEPSPKPGGPWIGRRKGMQHTNTR